MKDVVCHNGKCWEEKGNIIPFDDLFEKDSIVDQIEKDLWRNNFYGN